MGSLTQPKDCPEPVLWRGTTDVRVDHVQEEIDGGMGLTEFRMEGCGQDSPLSDQDGI